MTLRSRKKAAQALYLIVCKEFNSVSWSCVQMFNGMRRLAAQAHRQGLTPDDLLTRNGYDAFTVIARAIAHQQERNGYEGAEWALVVALADPRPTRIKKTTATSAPPPQQMDPSRALGLWIKIKIKKQEPIADDV